MKIYNKTRRRRMLLGMPGSKTVIESLPSRSIEVPDEVGQRALKDWPKVFTADDEAIRKEQVAQEALKERDAKIASLEAEMDRLQKLLQTAADPANPKAAQEAAGELDSIISTKAPKGGKADKAPKAPAAETAPKIDKEDFEG